MEGIEENLCGSPQLHTLHIENRIWVRFSFWVRLRKCVLPEGPAKELPKVMKIYKCCVLIDCTMVLPISKCEFDAENTPDALKHIPDLF